MSKHGRKSNSYGALDVTIASAAPVASPVTSDTDSDYTKKWVQKEFCPSKIGTPLLASQKRSYCSLPTLKVPRRFSHDKTINSGGYSGVEFGAHGDTDSDVVIKEAPKCQSTQLQRKRRRHVNRFLSTGNNLDHNLSYESLDDDSLEKVKAFLTLPPHIYPSINELTAIEKEREQQDEDPTKPPPLTRRQILIIVMLAFANFSSTVVFSCIAPFFPGEVIAQTCWTLEVTDTLEMPENDARKKGASDTEIGLIFGMFELCIFLTSPLFGRYLTQIGSKFMYGTGLFVTGCTSLLFGLLNWAPAGSQFVGLCFAVRTVEAVGDAAFITASFAITAHEFPGRIATIIGVLETFSGLGFTAGPAVGGILYQVGGFQLPFMALGCLLLVAAALSVPLIPAHVEQPTERRSGGGGFVRLLRVPTIALMCADIVVCAVCLTFIDPTLENHLGPFHLSSILVGLMFLLIGGVYTLTAPLWGYYVDRTRFLGEVMTAGAVAVGVAYLLIGPAPFFGFKKTLWLIGLSEVILGLSIGAFFIPTFKTSLDTAKEHGYPDSFETHGLVAGMFQSCFSFGGFLGPTIFGGVVVDAIGFEWTASILGFINLLLAVCLASFFVYKRQRRRTLQKNPTSQAVALLDDNPNLMTSPDSGLGNSGEKDTETV